MKKQVKTKTNPHKVTVFGKSFKIRKRNSPTIVDEYRELLKEHQSAETRVKGTIENLGILIREKEDERQAAVKKLQDEKAAFLRSKKIYEDTIIDLERENDQMAVAIEMLINQCRGNLSKRTLRFFWKLIGFRASNDSPGLEPRIVMDQAQVEEANN